MRGGICLSLLSPERGDSTKILYKNQADRKDLPDSFGISEEIQFAHGTFLLNEFFAVPLIGGTGGNGFFDTFLRAFH